MKLSESIVYISGPYRASTIFGVIRNIYKARRAAKRWWGEHPVICPHLNTALFGSDVKYIQGDLEIIRRLHRKDIIFMLEGWENSAGACKELELAIERGLQVKYERPPVFTPVEKVEKPSATSYQRSIAILTECETDTVGIPYFIKPEVVQ